MRATNEVTVGERLSSEDCPLYEDEKLYALGAGLGTMLDPNPLLDAQGSIPPMMAKSRLIKGWARRSLDEVAWNVRLRISAGCLPFLRSLYAARIPPHRPGMRAKTPQVLHLHRGA